MASKQINEELIFDIILKLNEGAYRNVKQVLGDLQKAQNDTKGTTKQTSAIKELDQASRDLKTSIIDLDLQRRKGSITVEEFGKQHADLTKELERLNKEYAKHGSRTRSIIQADKSLFLAKERMENGFSSMSRSTSQANLALGNMGRIIQDLPFGFLGISNNLDPALASIQQVKEETGSLGGAFKQILGQLISPQGLIFALGSLLPTAILLSQNGMIGFNNILGDNKKELEAYNEALKDQLDISKQFQTASPFDLNRKQEELDLLDEELRKRERLDEINIQLAQSATQGAYTVAEALEAEYEQIEKQLEASRYLNQETDELEERKEQLSATIKELTRTMSDSEIQFARYAEELRTGVTNAIEEYDLGLAGSKDGITDYISELDHLRRGLIRSVDAGMTDQLPYLRVVTDMYEKATGALDGYIENIDEVIARVKSEELDSALRAQRAKLEEIYSKDIELDLDLDLDIDTKRGRNPYANYISMVTRQERQLSQLRSKIAQAQLGEQLSIEDRYRIMLSDRASAIEDVNDTEYEDAVAKERALFDVKKYYMQMELQLAKEQANERKQIEEDIYQSKIAIAQNATSTISDLGTAIIGESEKNAKALFNLNKFTGIAEATINTYTAFTKALASAPPPFNYALAGSVMASGMAKVARIASMKFKEKKSADSSGSSRDSVKTGFYTQDVEDRDRRINEVTTRASSRTVDAKPTVNVTVNGEVNKEGIAWAVREGEDQIANKTRMVGML